MVVDETNPGDWDRQWVIVWMMGNRMQVYEL
jgi:hypothetical protein